jgi:hypothetical protein
VDVLANRLAGSLAGLDGARTLPPHSTIAAIPVCAPSRISALRTSTPARRRRLWFAAVGRLIGFDVVFEVGVVLMDDPFAAGIVVAPVEHMWHPMAVMEPRLPCIRVPQRAAQVSSDSGPGFTIRVCHR